MNGERESSDGAGAPPRYAAFLSYSHVDEAVAGKLHRQLEGYRLPARVRQGKAGARLGTIFRDRAELAAAPSLPDAIRSALEQSAALVVLCSPEARASHWVDQEIRLFQTVNPGAPVLPVILRGEPAAVMPSALTEGGNEPLAADFRKEADGRKLGFLKIVAALAGVPLDSLIQRDAQRRLWRVTAITAIAFMLVVAMSAMTAFAFSARREAERQRAEAEGLIEYMLTDLREDLRGVGRIDLMSAVNDRAFDYYEGQGPLADLSDDSLDQRARVMLALGEDEFKRARTAQAARLFAEAYASTGAALARAPDHPDRIFAHAQSEFWMGEVARVQGNPAANERALRAYATLARRLAAVEPGVRALRETGYAEGNLCSLTMRTERGLIEAEDHCRAALAAQREVLALRPDDRQAQVDVINRLSWLAEVQAARSDHRAALTSSREAERRARQLLDGDRDNKDTQDLLFAVLYARGEALRSSEYAAEAAAALDEAGVIIDYLRAVDPSNERWQRLAGELRESRITTGRSK